MSFDDSYREPSGGHEVESERIGSSPVWAVIAGGGTAGHIHPGLAVARALVRRGHDPGSVHFVGSARGVERDLVPQGGFELTLLPGRGLQRRLSVQNLSSAWGMAQAVRRAVGLLRQMQPCVVLGLGGYASVPCALAARRLKIPLVIAEQNAVPGVANRIAGRWAKAAAVSFPETMLPRPVLTGNPVRAEVGEVDRVRDRAAARAALGVADERHLVVVVGGSLGAARINRSAFGAARQWSDRHDLTIYHVVGRRDWADLAHLRPDLSGAALDYRAVEYEENLPGLYAAADLLIGRAGASSVAELAAVGLPSILVPLPGAPGDHQTANATQLVSAGGAVMVADADLDVARLTMEVDGLLEDPSGLASMGVAAADLGHQGADDRVAELLEECASRQYLSEQPPTHRHWSRSLRRAGGSGSGGQH